MVRQEGIDRTYRGQNIYIPTHPPETERFNAQSLGILPPLGHNETALPFTYNPAKEG